MTCDPDGPNLTDWDRLKPGAALKLLSRGLNTKIKCLNTSLSSCRSGSDSWLPSCPVTTIRFSAVTAHDKTTTRRTPPQQKCGSSRRAETFSITSSQSSRALKIQSGNQEVTMVARWGQTERGGGRLGCVKHEKKGSEIWREIIPLSLQWGWEVREASRQPPV